MYAVPQFMGQRHDVARFALIIQQNVRVCGGHRRVGKGAGLFAFPKGGVDPAAVEKLLGGFGSFRGRIRRRPESTVCSASFQVMMRSGFSGSGAFAVPVSKFVHAEPFGFEGIITVGRARVSVVHGCDERIDNLAFYSVGQVAAVGHVL